MSDFHLVDPQGWEYDLQSVYSAYIGYFQLHGVLWHDRTWGQFFETFEQFLAFSWPVVTVTDARTGRAHIVTRMSSITAFLKMIKSRFGETLPQVENMLRVTPFETSQRHLRHVDDGSTYKKLHSALPAVALAALKARVRGGDPNAIRGLWAMRDKTFLAIDFECLERNDRSCVEWGYAAIRSSHLVAAGAWPPVPNTNYRKGHYIISDYADTLNKASLTVSWQYAFGESQVIPKARMPRIIQSILSSLVSPDSDTVANNVVLVGHGVQLLMQRLDEMKIKLPNNLLMLDVAYLERALFTTGERGPMHDRKTGRARLPEALLSLGGLLRSLGIAPPCVLHNAGNDAFMMLVAFQRMVDPRREVSAGVSVGIENGNGMGKGQEREQEREQGGQGAAPNGHGHAKRAATVTARFFRPLGGAHPGPPERGAHLRLSGYGGPGAGLGAVDEMGMAHKKRASVFSMRSSWMASTDRQRKGVTPSQGSAHGSGSGSGLGIGWLSQSRIVPSQRRHSVIEKR